MEQRPSIKSHLHSNQNLANAIITAEIICELVNTSFLLG
jgi:hypothetical protein